MANVTTESLLKAARVAKIKLPKSKKESMEEVENAMAAARRDDGPCEEGAVLQILEDKYGVKKPTGKRKAEAVAEEEEKGSKSASAAVLDEVWDVTDKGKKGACATKLIGVAKARGVRMPDDDKVARMGAFGAVMGVKGEAGTCLVKDAVEFLEDKYGKDPAWIDPDDKAPKKKKASTAKQATCPENSDLAEAFDELAGLYFKEQSKAGFVYKKVVSSIKDWPQPLLAAPKKGEIKGIGAKTIAKIKEFLETGKIQELEDKRADSVA